MNKNCLQCGKETYAKITKIYKGKIYTYYYAKKKFCSYDCYHSYYKGKPLTGKALESSKISVRKAIEVRKNNPIVREEWLEKMRDRKGPKNSRWIADRSKLVNQEERNNYKYVQWTIAVKDRDGNECKMHNQDCVGRIEVHHILSWRDFPELRYKINNGITLCQFHHPRVRSEEKRLVTFLQGLVSVSN